MENNFIYRSYEWCFEKYIIEGLNHEEMALEANTTKRTIEKWCTEKHRLTQKYRQQNKELSKIQRDLIIGSMLGDGHIDNRTKQPIFIVSHSEIQKDYLYWKYNILKDLCNKEPSIIEEKDKIFDNKIYKSKKAYRLCTRIYDCLLEIRDMSVIELLDNLNKFSFSILILDDGYRDNRGLWQYCIAPYSKEEIDYMIKIFKEKFNIEGYIKETDERYLKFRKNDSIIIDKIILKNIPNNLDIIKYKIL